MEKLIKIKTVLLAALICVATVTLVACQPPASEGKITLAFGQSTAYFTTSDIALYPIAGEMPGEGESVEKLIKIVFTNAKKVALAFDFEGDVPSGLKYSANNGAARDFEAGEFFVNEVAESDTEITVRLKIWLSADAPESLAGSTFGFTIKALGE